MPFRNSLVNPLSKTLAKPLAFICLLLLLASSIITQPANAATPDDSWVYYWVAKKPYGPSNLYRDKPTSSTQKPIKMTSTALDEIAQTDDYVYYLQRRETDLSGRSTGYIYRMDKKTKKTKKLPRRDVYAIAASDNAIYYAAKDALYKASADGSNEKVFINEPVVDFAISFNWLYYNKYKEDTLNRIRLDGTNDQLLTDKDEKVYDTRARFEVFGHWINYYTNSGHFVKDADQPEQKRIEVQGTIVDITDDSLYTRYGNTLYQKDISTGKEASLSELGWDLDLTKIDGAILSYHFAGDYLLYIDQDGNLKKLTFKRP